MQPLSWHGFSLNMAASVDAEVKHNFDHTPYYYISFTAVVFIAFIPFIYCSLFFFTGTLLFLLSTAAAIQQISLSWD